MNEELSRLARLFVPHLHQKLVLADETLGWRICERIAINAGNPVLRTMDNPIAHYFDRAA